MRQQSLHQQGLTNTTNLSNNSSDITRVTNGTTNSSGTKLKPKKSKSPSLTLGTTTVNGQTATTQLSPTSTGSSHSTNRQFDLKQELLGSGNVNSVQSSQTAINHHMIAAANQHQNQQNNLQSNLNAQINQQSQGHNLNNLNNLNNQQMHHLHQMTTAGQQYQTYAQHQQMHQLHHSHLNHHHHDLQSPVQNITSPSQYHQHAANLQNHHAAVVAHHHMLGQHQLNAVAAVQQSNQLQSNYCISPSSRTDSESPYNAANNNSTATTNNSTSAVQQVQSNNGSNQSNNNQSNNNSNGTQTPNSQPTASTTPSSNQFTPPVLIKRESPNFSSSLHHSFTNSNSNGSSSSNSQALVANNNNSNSSTNSSSNSSISLSAAAVANAINTSAGNFTPNDTQTLSLIPPTSAHHHHHPITSLHPAVYNMANANAAVFNHHQNYVPKSADSLAFDQQLSYTQHARSLWNPVPLNPVTDIVNNYMPL